MQQMTYEELEAAHNKLKENYSKLQNEYNLLANQYNAVVIQNQSLQQALREKDSGESNL